MNNINFSGYFLTPEIIRSITPQKFIVKDKTFYVTSLESFNGEDETVKGQLKNLKVPFIYGKELMNFVKAIKTSTNKTLKQYKDTLAKAIEQRFNNSNLN